MQRGSSLRCWKCGLDLTVPYVPEGAGAATAGAGATPGVAGEEGSAMALGPAPRGWLARTFDPRITKEELERAARGYDHLPWTESYRKPAGLGLLPLALVLVLVRSGLAEIWTPLGAGNAALVAQEAHLAFVIQLLGWAAIGVLALALFVYRGNAWAILLAAAAWLVAIGCFPFTVPADFLRFAPAYLPFLLPVYVELVLLWKALRVSFAHAEFAWGRQVAHDARS